MVDGDALEGNEHIIISYMHAPNKCLVPEVETPHGRGVVRPVCVCAVSHVFSLPSCRRPVASDCVIPPPSVQDTHFTTTEVQYYW